jgi:hypothetical protein
MTADQGAKANPRSAPPAIADGLGRRFSFHAFGLWPHGVSRVIVAPSQPGLPFCFVLFIPSDAMARGCGRLTLDEDERQHRSCDANA